MRVLFAVAVLTVGAALVAAQDEKKEPPAGDKKPAEPPKEPKEPTQPPVADPRLATPPMIEGVYTIAAAERDGRPVPLDGYRDAVVRVVSGRIVGTDRDRREFLVATYALNIDKKPWALDMKVLITKTEPAKGLAKKEDRVLTLIHALPGGDAPTEFKTKPGQQMFVLREFVLDPLPTPNKFAYSP